MTRSPSRLFGFALLPFFLVSALSATFAPWLASGDRCTLKLTFNGGPPAPAPWWTPSCSGHCNESGGACTLQGGSVPPPGSGTGYRCLCGTTDPNVLCDGVFYESSPAQECIKIHCADDRCWDEYEGECEVNYGHFGSVPANACVCMVSE